MTKHTRTLLIIAGMHRSGTSLLSCLCHHLGAELGTNLIPAPEQENALGYWEPQAVVDMHEEAFSVLKLKSDDCDTFNTTWHNSKGSALLQKQIGGWLDQFDGQNLISVKDPRICRFLPDWTFAAEKKQLTPAYILPFRNPLEVAQSLIKRHPQENRDIQRSLLWWSVNMLDAERDSRAINKTFKRSTYYYPELIEDWQKVMQKIERDLGFSWPVAIADAAPIIIPLINPNLRRNNQTTDELREVDQLGFATEIFDIFTVWNNGNSLDKNSLDSIYFDVQNFLATLPPSNGAVHGSDEEISSLAHAIKQWHKPKWKKLLGL